MYLLDLFDWLIQDWSYLPLIDLDVKLEGLCDSHTEDPHSKPVRKGRYSVGATYQGNLQALRNSVECHATPGLRDFPTHKCLLLPSCPFFPPSLRCPL